MKPPLLPLDGAPESGKSTLAELLCPQLRLPLDAKDPVKEALADALKIRTLDASYALGSSLTVVAEYVRSSRTSLPG